MNSTAINAVKRRVPPSLQEHFASGQLLLVNSPHLLAFSKLQNSHSAPSLAFNPQGSSVLQSRALMFLFSKGMEAGLVALLKSVSLLREKRGPHVLLASLTERQHAHIQILNSSLVSLPYSHLSLPEQALTAPLRDEAAGSSSSASHRLTNKRISASSCCGDRAHGT